MANNNENETVRSWFKRGDMLTPAEVARFLGTRGGGWFDAPSGQRVYACDGTHKDMSRGYKVLDLGGLK